MPHTFIKRNGVYESWHHIKMKIAVVLIISLENTIELSNANVYWKDHSWFSVVLQQLLFTDQPGYSWFSWLRRAVHRYKFSWIIGNDLFLLFLVLYIHTICVLIISLSQVSEFSPSTSSALGLPREFHENCRKSLEQNFLKVIVELHLLPDIYC